MARLKAANVHSGVMCMLLMVSGIVSARPTDVDEQNAVIDIIERVNAKDCAGAIERLNAGLAADSPRVALLAGNMYEQGICLKPNLDRAAGYYITAHNGGEHAAAYRLAAAYATPEAGPDPAAALWWLKQTKGRFGEQRCDVDKLDAEDPDRFVAALQKWSPARIATCNYLAGVVATIAGEAQYPRGPHQFEPDGTVMVRVTPALANVTVWTLKEDGVFSAARADGEKYQQRATRRSRFERVVKEIADRALARYPQPAGVDPTWVQEFSMVFVAHL